MKWAQMLLPRSSLGPGAVGIHTCGVAKGALEYTAPDLEADFGKEVQVMVGRDVRKMVSKTCSG
jgi:hypothetical protein